MADGGHLGNEPEKVPSRFLRYVSFFLVLIDTSMILNQQVSFMFQFFPGSTILRATVQITFIFIGQTRLVFGKCVCTYETLKRISNFSELA